MAYTGYDLEYRKQFVAEVRKELLPNGQISRQTFDKFEAVAKADRKAGKIESNEYGAVWGFLSQTMQGCGMNGNPGLNPSYRGRA